MTDTLLERHRFYEENKVAILSDVKRIGEKATAKEWNVTGASLYHVLQRWEREAKGNPGAGTPALSLPALPPFSNEWMPEVQVKWLEVYEKLTDGHSSQNGVQAHNKLAGPSP